MLIALLLLPFGAFAADFALLDGDRPLKRDEIVAFTANKTIVFYEGGHAQYSVGGAYSYTYEGGSSAFGRYEIDREGVICIFFRNGRDRCDQFVQSHGRLIMITQQGQRFAIRP